MCNAEKLLEMHGLTSVQRSQLMGLLEYQTITVRRYDCGCAHATHGRWQAASNRLTFTSLGDPDERLMGPDWGPYALVEAALDLAPFLPAAPER